ncbi:DMT family transporter [Alterisphingorhabdus coralli]|uniref:DMT family transporter n=1 Tax=Alterisphingorhabdus coralli TaxID=3071408 RepID=A0AA97F7F4_9SPHN|nr:DMT family transporter [Parasphingorhabdus sp. SCSIO 66989]WOE74647.1 DMT family transporter [Parasphingorhabdus sp. SCSIO 66989]
MLRITALLLLALLAFAGNSLLNRAALADGAIDWASFTIVRLVSGALMLTLLLGFRHGRNIWPRADSWPMALALSVYAAAFSLAYVQLSAGTGALILFALVQITMQGIGIVKGVRPNVVQWAGLALAFAGLLYLLLPGVTAPPLGATLMMALSGAAWGSYSWLGRSVDDPRLATARNFLGAVPLALLLLPFVGNAGTLEPYGFWLAIASGAVTSALGYILWYAVLPRISVTLAATAQLSVPAIAALGGVLLLGEGLDLRLIAGSLAIIGGIALTIIPGRSAR